MTRFVLFLLGIAVLCSGVTYLISRLTRKTKFVKYSTALVCLLLAAYYFYLAKTVTTEFADLANVIVAVMFLVGCVSSLLTCLVVDVVTNSKPK